MSEDTSRPPRWSLDTATGILADGEGRSVRLSGQEITVVRMLASARGATVSRDRLWHVVTERGEMKTLDVYLSRIRRKLREAGMRCPLRTAFHQGYSWDRPTTASGLCALVPPSRVDALRRLLATHHDKALARDLREAILNA